MNKDFAVIKEMSKKKLLTATEKAPLLKIFEARITRKVNELRAKQSEEESKMEIAVLKKLSDRADIKKATATIDRAEKETKQAEKFLEDNGLSYGGSYNTDKKTLKVRSTYDDNRPKDIIELRKKHAKQMAQAEELTDKIKLSLFEADITLTDINEIVNSELEKLA